MKKKICTKLFSTKIST